MVALIKKRGPLRIAREPSVETSRAEVRHDANDLLRYGEGKDSQRSPTEEESGRGGRILNRKNKIPIEKEG